jgi:hypothetical protein
MKHRVVITIFVSLFLMACGPTPSDRERFRELGSEVCARRVACDLTPSAERTQCIEEFVERSCADVEDCDERYSLRSENDWENCLEAVREYECEKLEQRLLPGYCITAWRDPDTLPAGRDAGPAW